MVDALQAGTFNPAQQETVQTLRAALVALAEEGRVLARVKGRSALTSLALTRSARPAGL